MPLQAMSAAQGPACLQSFISVCSLAEHPSFLQVYLSDLVWNQALKSAHHPHKSHDEQWQCNIGVVYIVLLSQVLTIRTPPPQKYLF